MKWHKVAPFNFFYTLATLEELKEWCKKKKVPIPPIPEDYSGFACTSGAFSFVVLDPKYTKNHWETVGTIIHESVHVFQDCMKYIQETEIGIELEAYIIEAIATTLLKDYDAIHARWKKGLQTGVQGVPCPPGPNQESL